MTEHTKEPWFFEDKTVYALQDCVWLGLQSKENRFSAFVNGKADDKELQANARRIVACVNALAHISTEQLESGELLHMGQMIKDMTKQRDELLAAVEGVIVRCASSGCVGGDDEYIELLRALVKKVEASNG